MPKQKIATLIWRDGFGGAERSLSDLADALDQSRFDMRFYYLSGGPGSFAKKIEKMGFETIFLKWKSGFDVTGRFRLLKKLKEFNPHVIHDHIIPPLIRVFIKIFLRRPILNTEHGRALQRRLGIGNKRYRIVERFDLWFCNYIAANSATSAEALQAAYGVAGSKIGIVHLGINLNQFKPVCVKRPPADVVTCGYVGRIVNEHKGVDYLPFVAGHLADQYGIRFKILVAGDGPDRKAVEQLCKDRGVAGHFTFLGWVEDVNSFLQEIDILIVPSRHESLGLSAIEALAMNVPVVAFAVGGLREILADCPIGKLIKPGDIRGMAEAVYALRNHHLNGGITGREFVAERFSNDKMARRYETIYSHLSKK